MPFRTFAAKSAAKPHKGGCPCESRKFLFHLRYSSYKSSSVKSTTAITLRGSVGIHAKSPLSIGLANPGLGLFVLCTNYL
jgi:hypothetical protein